MGHIGLPLLFPTECFTTVLLALCGTYRIPLCEGRVQVVCRPLPRGMPAAVAEYEGTLWVFLDVDQPSAARHARALLLDTMRVVGEGEGGEPLQFALTRGDGEVFVPPARTASGPCELRVAG